MKKNIYNTAVKFLEIISVNTKMDLTLYDIIIIPTRSSLAPRHVYIVDFS